TVSVSVSGGTLFMNGSAVVVADIFASNGVAHGINGVLIPSNVSLGGSTIWELIQSDNRFSKLEHALRETGLAHELANSNAEFTMFLPTNDAFHRLGSVKLHWLFKSKSRLRAVLKNHIVVNQTLDIATLRSQGRVTNANHNRLAITQSNGRTYVNNSRVQQADERAKNGIAHVISSVLL
ncbi:MAG: fasciclin domain-containing protein, partial [Granulosicoccus sp.]